MISSPKISIIVPCYNSEKYIIPCLESIKNQTYKNIEVIVIDNESTDNTYNIIKEYNSGKLSNVAWKSLAGNLRIKWADVSGYPCPETSTIPNYRTMHHDMSKILL